MLSLVSCLKGRTSSRGQPERLECVCSDDRGTLYTNLLAAVHLIDAGLIDDLVVGVCYSVGSAKDLGCSEYELY